MRNKKELRLMIIAFFLPIILAYTSYAECISPQGIANISSSVEFCRGNYSIGEIDVNKGGVLIDCMGSVLQCKNNTQAGLSIISKESVTIQDCIIEGCGNAVYIVGSRGISIYGSTFSENIIVVAVESSAELDISGNTFIQNTIGGLSSIGSDIDSENLIQKNRFQKEPKIIGEYSPEEDNEEEIPQPLADNDSIEKDPSDENKHVTLVELTPQTINELLREIFQLSYPKAGPEIIDRIIGQVSSEYTNNIKKRLKIERSFDHKNNMTKVSLNISSLPPLNNASLYESIPKCAARFAGEVIIAQKDYEVLQDDPLIVWNFEKIDNKMIRYDIAKNLPQACKDMFRTIVLPSSYGSSASIEELMHDFAIKEKKKSSPVSKKIIIPAIIITVILLTLLFLRARH